MFPAPLPDLLSHSLLSDQTRSLPDPGRELPGRAVELAALAALLDRAGAGEGGGAVLIHGTPGGGKSALLRHAAEVLTSAQPAPFTVLETCGVQAETDLPYAALQRFLMPVAAGIPELPPAQARILTEALSTGVDEPQARFALCVAVLNLLVMASRRAPVLGCVDDADVIDRPSIEVLAFAARRLTTENVVLLAAATDRRPVETLLPGVERLPLAGLDLSASQALLAELAPSGLTAEVAIELTQLCAGNPMALRELAGTLTVEQARGRAPLPTEFPRGSVSRCAYDARLGALPAATRMLLLIAAADPDGLDLSVLMAAAQAGDGTDPGALEPAEAAGLVHVVDGRVRFRLPLVGGGIYQGAPLETRRAVHRLIAGVLDGAEPEPRLRRLWHVAATGDASPEPLAVELAEAADAVRDRGDHAAASLAAEQAAQLSPHVGARTDHLLAAARDAWQAGRRHRAGVLLTRLRAAPWAVTTGGHRELLRGEIELRTGSPATAHETLLAAATRLAGHDPTAAVVALLHAGEASFLTGDLRRYVDISLRALALREGGDPPERELMFEYAAGMMALFRGRHSEATRRLRQMLELVPQIDDPTAIIWASLAALMLGEEARAYSLTERASTLARTRGEVTLVPRALELATCAQLWLGRYGAAIGSAQEGLRLAQQAGLDNSVTFHRSTLALLSMLQGDDDTGLLHANAVTTQSAERGLAMPLALASWALAHRDLAGGRAGDAAGRLRALSTAGGNPGYVTGRVLTAPHFVEAAVRCGDRAGAVEATELFGRWATNTRSAAARALLARCQALVATDPSAIEDAYQEALRMHLMADSEFERARTELLYGHELRRRRGPLAAREHLRSAFDTFERLGAESWVEQCRSELRATGESLRPGPTRLATDLTAQQLKIAEIVAQGATNREVAAQLYLSPRTVDHHMRNIFVKLGVRSRVELVRLLS